MSTGTDGSPLAGMRVAPRPKYLSIGLTSLQQAVSYRVTTLLGMLSQLVWVVVLFYVWRAVYGGRREVASFEWGEIQTYLLVAFAVNTLLSFRSMSQMSAPIRTGAVATDLVRPVDYMTAQLARALGRAVVEGAASGVLAIVVAVVLLDARAPASPAAGAAFVVSLVLAFLVKFLVHHMVTLLCFFTTNATGLIWAETATVNLLSGALLPVAFFPGWLQTVISVLPFHAIVAAPVGIYLGQKSGVAILGALALQAVWVCALFAAARAMWRPTIRALDIQGG